MQDTTFLYVKVGRGKAGLARHNFVPQSPKQMGVLSPATLYDFTAVHLHKTTVSGRWRGFDFDDGIEQNEMLNILEFGESEMSCDDTHLYDRSVLNSAF